MPIAPKKSRRNTPDVKDKFSYGWVYLAKNKESIHAPVSCRSLETLCKIANDYTYITPSGFWHNQKRNKSTLRWLNAFVLDYDDLIDPEEVLGRIDRSGLPSPTFLNQTDSGIHAWWVFDKPVRVASRKVVSLYDGIHRDMVYAADADKHFVAASERFVRLPKHIVWQSATLNRYSLDTFKEWREINVDRSAQLSVKLMNKGAWVSSPGIQALLQMDVPDGQRHGACLTLALAFKADGYDTESTSSALTEWNTSLSEPIPQAHIQSTISSAYRNRYKHPSRVKLALVVGKALAYAKVRYITPAKPRSERSEWHLKEISELIITDLQEHKLVEETQVEWAKRLAVPLRSFKKVLADLRSAGIVFGICGRGRFATSYYKLSETFLLHGPVAFLSDCEEVRKEKHEMISVPESDDLAVDISDFEVNGAYPLIQEVGGVEGGFPRSLPGYLLGCLRDFIDSYLSLSGTFRECPLENTG